MLGPAGNDLRAGPRFPGGLSVHAFRFLAVLAAALSLPSPRAFAAEPRLVVAFDDPAGDATGPGSYVPPSDAMFTDGDFDLRRFAVYEEGDTVRFEVTLGAAIRRPDPARRTDAIPSDLANGIYLQNVDIYVDSDPGPGSGYSACIPGRRIAFADGRTWETAVVLTPRPGAAHAVVAEALGAAAAHVLFPGPLEIRGSTIVARVPITALGGPPRKEWGWSVQISGARWERDPARSDRVRGAHEADAFTMPVLGVREARAFGGAPAGEVHPRVVDVLLPPGADQKTVLGSFDAATGSFARVPFVYAVAPLAPQAAAPRAPPPSLTARLMPSPPRPASAPSAPGGAGNEGTGRTAPAGPVLTVAGISEDVVTLAGSIIGLAPTQLGRILGQDGATVGHVVIERVLENGVVARIVSGRENVRWGARVRFDGQTISR